MPSTLSANFVFPFSLKPTLAKTATFLNDSDEAFSLFTAVLPAVRRGWQECAQQGPGEGQRAALPLSEPPAVSSPGQHSQGQRLFQELCPFPHSLYNVCLEAVRELVPFNFKGWHPLTWSQWVPLCCLSPSVILPASRSGEATHLHPFPLSWKRKGEDLPHPHVGRNAF